MWLQNKQLLVLVALFGTIVCGCAHNRSVSQDFVTSNEPLSTPVEAEKASEASEASALDAAQDFQAFQMQPPAGFTLVTQEGAGGDRIWTWQGDIRDDGSLPMLSVAVSDPRVEGSEAFKVVQMADKARLETVWILNMTLSLYGASPKFKRTKTERLSINGQPFARASFSAPYREDSDALAHGVLYVASHPGRVIEIWAIDSEPEHKAFLSLAESAIMTFRENAASEQTR